MSYNIDLNHAQATAERAARAAAVQIREAIQNWRRNEIRHKAKIDIVTDVDVRVEREVSAALLADFPMTKVVGEEGSVEELLKTGGTMQSLCSKGPVWVIDPIDGTNNFSNHLPLVAISIALLIDGVREVGVCLDPMRDEMFSAIRGRGATLNGKPIAPSDCATLIGALVGISFPVNRGEHWRYYWDALEPVVLNCRTARVIGSGVLNQCWVACGRFDAVVEHNWKLWDVAAGSLIAQEAGCIATNIDAGLAAERHEPLDLFKKSFLFSGPNLFEELFECVKTARTAAK